LIASVKSYAEVVQEEISTETEYFKDIMRAIEELVNKKFEEEI
jgi:hypothetical protein